ncbi:MAG: hypothetical protein KAJ19_18615 [Gammaproteobacteria bacterium]|nr:hypothetical protein [Gammaproteobacteria bacterium]
MEKLKEQPSNYLARNELATRRHGVGTALVKSALAMPLACSPEHMISVDVASPGLVEFEQQQEAARKIKEMEDRLQREREVKRYTKD